MLQFTAYENLNPTSRGRYPLLLNVQSDLIAETDSRVVVPLYLLEGDHDPMMSTLSPVLDTGSDRYVLMTPLLAGMALGRLGKPVVDLSNERDTIMAALDMLISGI